MDSRNLDQLSRDRGLANLVVLKGKIFNELVKESAGSSSIHLITVLARRKFERSPTESNKPKSGESVC